MIIVAESLKRPTLQRQNAIMATDSTVDILQEAAAAANSKFYCRFKTFNCSNATKETVALSYLMLFCALVVESTLLPEPKIVNYSERAIDVGTKMEKKGLSLYNSSVCNVLVDFK